MRVISVTTVTGTRDSVWLSDEDMILVEVMSFQPGIFSLDQALTWADYTATVAGFHDRIALPFSKSYPDFITWSDLNIRVKKGTGLCFSLADSNTNNIVAYLLAESADFPQLGLF